MPAQELIHLPPSAWSLRVSTTREATFTFCLMKFGRAEASTKSGIRAFHFPNSTSSWLQARWALHHHGIDHSNRDYTPFFDVLCLRWRLRDWRGKITVPVLLTSTGAVRDSAAIARWCDDHSLPGASPLFPSAQLEDIDRCNASCPCRIAELFLQRISASKVPADIASFMADRHGAAGRFDKRCLKVMEYERGVFTAEAQKTPVQA